jgi:hypothetical protein
MGESPRSESPTSESPRSESPTSESPTSESHLERYTNQWPEERGEWYLAILEES